MTKILDRNGLGAAISPAENDANLSSLHGINQAIAAASHSIDIDDQGDTVEYTNGGAVAVTLGALATITSLLHTDDYKVTLLASGTGTVVTITPNAADSFNDYDDTIVLRTGDWVTLQTDSTLGIWNIVARAPRRVLLDSQDGTGLATVDFTGLTNDYLRYEVEFDDVRTATNSNTFIMTLYESAAWISGNFITTNGSGADLHIVNGDLLYDANLNVQRGATGKVEIWPYVNNTKEFYCSSRCTYLTDFNTLPAVYECGGVGKFNAAVTGIRFKLGTGNLVAGDFRLYGVRY